MHDPSSTARSASGDPAGEGDPAGAERTDRQVGWLISLGGAAVVLGQSAELFAHAIAAPSWWSLGVACIASTVLCLAVFGRVLPFRVLRLGWIGIPVLGWCLWLAAFLVNGVEDADAVVLWAWTLQPVVTSYLVLWVRPLVAVALTVVSALLPGLSAAVFVGSVPPAVAAVTPILLSNVVYLAIFFGIRTRLNRLRLAEGRAREQHRRTQASAAEAQRQERLRRLIHDEVLSVLTAAMSLRGTPPPQLRAEARHAMLLLDTSGASPSGAPHYLDADDALTALTSALRRIDPSCALFAEASPVQIPTEALAAIVDAAGEALRNSVTHAGIACSRNVEARLGPDGVRVVVRDRGPGFELASVDPARLGVRESILARMAALDGGDARIRTNTGGGTEVELTWRT